MTALLKPDHLHQIARVLDQPGDTRQRLIPLLQWTIDVETGRPAARWVLTEERDDAT